ncbi:uncharacterized protein [Oscarella lobularis]|uniref:uncharacterized protein n=1 Tax=Oscarella lobularis TaxID=121494 RepID=UPI0033138ED9
MAPLRVPSVFMAFLGLCTLACMTVIPVYFRHHYYILELASVKRDRGCREAVVVKRRATSLIDDVLCSGLRPILRCVRNASVPSLPLDGVKSWQYRLARDADFSRHDQLSSRHETCALVGSSYNLMKNEFGAEIDSRDLVVRLNDPPVKGYEKHVGARPADISIFNFVMAKIRKKCAEPPRNGSLMVQCSFSVDKGGGGDDAKGRAETSTQCAESTWRKYGLKTYVMSNYVFGMAERALAYHPVRRSTERKYRPTCGLRSIIFLMGLCQNLHLYGFGGTNDADPYKYYSKSTTKHIYEATSHDFIGESHFIDNFANLTAFGLSWNGKLIVHR